jgi:hypothetical protein
MKNVGIGLRDRVSGFKVGIRNQESGFGIGEDLFPSIRNPEALE